MPSRSVIIRSENIVCPRRSPRFLHHSSNHDDGKPELRKRSSSKSTLGKSSRLGLDLSVQPRGSSSLGNSDEVVAFGKKSSRKGATRVKKCTAMERSKISRSNPKLKKGCEVSGKKSSRPTLDNSSRRVSPRLSRLPKIDEVGQKPSCNERMDRVLNVRLHTGGLTSIEETGGIRKFGQALDMNQVTCLSPKQVNSGGFLSASSGSGCNKIKAKRKGSESFRNNGLDEGWTKEQEMALNNAYLASKPTPYFWKNVAKLVPGKSAQECFDKIHSDNITTPQPRPGSRKKQSNSVPSLHPPLSSSKLLKVPGPKSRQINKPNLGKLRSLLQTQCHSPETDLFRLLEPTTDAISSTPNPSLKLRFISGMMSSSSSCKRPVSRFSALSGANLASPPVLKPVKNQALHERYISQLHHRDVKRKSSAAAKECVGSSTVRDAKDALVFDAKDLLRRLGTEHVDDERSSSEGGDDGDVMSLDGEEGGELLTEFHFAR